MHLVNIPGVCQVILHLTARLVMPVLHGLHQEPTHKRINISGNTDYGTMGRSGPYLFYLRDLHTADLYTYSPLISVPSCAHMITRFALIQCSFFPPIPDLFFRHNSVSSRVFALHLVQHHFHFAYPIFIHQHIQAFL